MIDIQGELLQIKQQREQKYISIVELLDFLKKQSPNSSFKDIAKWLLVKLELNDSRNVDIFNNIDHQNWAYEYEIPNFYVPLEIKEKPVELSPSSFFDALKEIDVVPLFGRENTANNYLPIDKSDIYLERARVEKFLGFSTINNEIFIEKNSAIEKNKIITESEVEAKIKAQQDRIAELEQKLQQSAVNSERVLENAKAYDVRERETHLLMIGALSNLLAGYKQSYQKGSNRINQSAISRGIEHEIIKLLQPETKTRTLDTIRPRIREALNLITKAE
ncbi:hypothetical protein [Haemophilus aegyptius]|uniref:hypothetical protein n=1 Tax=Haemophilus aegyptius TaxID=197575 RepID=UPI0008034693|nr:hypothetical protein [Haemophilus aegyptius]OBX80321.1 hypothetical protein A9506_02405 [Haemophilus aegyptius]STO62016.1 Uncharacterised protein [Haemophilus aegyptius]